MPSHGSRLRPRPAGLFAPLPGVRRRSRLLAATVTDPAAGRARARPGLLEWATLLALGGAAALITAFARVPLRLPGHQLLFDALPVALGLALVPRRAAGSVMGAGAAALTGGLLLSGVALPGVGALTGAIALGPVLDLALALAHSADGARLYGAFAVAGIVANAAAFLARAATRLLGDTGRGGPLGAWWPHALVSHLAFGLLVGVLSASLCFRSRDPGAAAGSGADGGP